MTVVHIALSNPREEYGLGFSTWSLRILARFLMHNLEMVDRISHHSEIRNIILEHERQYTVELKPIFRNTNK